MLAPDQYSISVNFGSLKRLGLAITIDARGQVYMGPQATTALEPTLVDITVSGTWLFAQTLPDGQVKYVTETPSAADLKSFNQGLSQGTSAGCGPGVCTSVSPGTGAAAGLQFSFPPAPGVDSSIGGSKQIGTISVSPQGATPQGLAPQLQAATPQAGTAGNQSPPIFLFTMPPPK